MAVGRSLLGSAAVVGARKRAGLTQEQLALKAGVSVRAVRDLELGRVHRPRRATLDLIAASIGLSQEQATALHDAWCVNGDFRAFVDMIHVEGDLEAILPRDDRPGDYQHQMFFEKLIIGSDRRLLRAHTMTQIEALEPNVSSRTVIWGGDVIHSAASAQLTSVTGAIVSSRTVLADLDLVVFELSFPSMKSVGATHTLSFDLEFDDTGERCLGSGQPDTASTATTCEAARGYRRQVGCHVMHVVFDGCPPPAQAWEIREGTVGGWRNWQRGHPVPVFGDSIESHRVNAPAGMHGLLWEW